MGLAADVAEASRVIVAGIDMGARSVKVVVLRDGARVGRGQRLSGFAAAEAASQALAEALAEAGLPRDALSRIVATGVGREEAPGRTASHTEVRCAARAGLHLCPSARTIIDVGAEEARAIRCDEKGRVLEFAVNEKCAAGTGAFAEAVARALEVSLDELGPLSLRGRKTVPLSAQCVVFAESELVSLIHANVPREDLARSVHQALAARVAALARRIAFTPPLGLLGGLARNGGFVEALRDALAAEVLVPADPELGTALGAALLAGEG